METYARYAVYWAPGPDDPLGPRGAAWLGWDPAARADVAQPEVATRRPMSEITADPARYGLHGTLKPPFRLADGVDREALEHAVADLASRLTAFPAPDFRISGGLGFLALVPSAPSAALDQLAGAVVRDLDPLRAPLNDAELARRRTRPLTDRQERNLVAWGYPYVLDEFRFHVTLSGRLRDDDEGAQLTAAAERHFAGALGFSVDALTLFGDPGGGAPFHRLTRFPLAPAP